MLRSALLFHDCVAEELLDVCVLGIVVVQIAVVLHAELLQLLVILSCDARISRFSGYFLKDLSATGQLADILFLFMGFGGTGLLSDAHDGGLVTRACRHEVAGRILRLFGQVLGLL